MSASRLAAFGIMLWLFIDTRRFLRVFLRRDPPSKELVLLFRIVSGYIAISLLMDIVRFVTASLT
jgi:hypothetical protein